MQFIALRPLIGRRTTYSIVIYLVKRAKVYLLSIGQLHSHKKIYSF